MLFADRADSLSRPVHPMARSAERGHVQLVVVGLLRGIHPVLVVMRDRGRLAAVLAVLALQERGLNFLILGIRPPLFVTGPAPASPDRTGADRGDR